jgi:hypothetical protein
VIVLVGVDVGVRVAEGVGEAGGSGVTVGVQVGGSAPDALPALSITCVEEGESVCAGAGDRPSNEIRSTSSLAANTGLAEAAKTTIAAPSTTTPAAETTIVRIRV